MIIRESSQKDKGSTVLFRASIRLALHTKVHKSMVQQEWLLNSFTFHNQKLKEFTKEKQLSAKHSWLVHFLVKNQRKPSKFNLIRGFLPCAVPSICESDDDWNELSENRICFELLGALSMFLAMPLQHQIHCHKASHSSSIQLLPCRLDIMDIVMGSQCSFWTGNADW
jgi:hypothetical protein